jgi:hypothetical protein
LKIDLSSMQMRGAAGGGRADEADRRGEEHHRRRDRVRKYASFLEAQKALTQRLAPITDSLRRAAAAPRRAARPSR